MSYPFEAAPHVFIHLRKDSVNTSSNNAMYNAQHAPLSPSSDSLAVIFHSVPQLESRHPDRAKPSEVKHVYLKQ